MIIKQYVAGPIDANNYLVVDQKTCDAVLIDCSEYKQEILQDIEDLDANVKHILLTHGHFDHILGIDKMREKLHCDVLMNEKDMWWVENVNKLLPQFDVAEIVPPKIDNFIKNGDIIDVGSLKIKVLSTPGHTKGSVCFLLDNVLFSGDTLFRGCVGRCDLTGGSYDDIKHSVRDILFKLPNGTKICPGHSASSTIEYEKKYNNEV